MMSETRGLGLVGGGEARGPHTPGIQVVMPPPGSRQRLGPPACLAAGSPLPTTNGVALPGLRRVLTHY